MYKESNKMTDQEVFEAMEKAESQLVMDLSELSGSPCSDELTKMNYEFELNRNINQPLGIVFLS